MRVPAEADKRLPRVAFVPENRAKFYHDGCLFSFKRTIENQSETIELSARGKNLEYLQDLAQQIYANSNVENRQVGVFQPLVTDEHMEWARCSSTSRDIQTVFFNQDILRDAEKYFSEDERVYNQDRGIPHRRGYLFHGPPGTGKSSLSRALATHFEIPIYQIWLASSELTDSRLLDLGRNLPKRCVLLMEDLQGTGLSTKHGSPDKLSFACLINFIDGAAAPEGRLLIMTTNDEGGLHPALTRTGRIDQRFEFFLADEACLQKLFLSLIAGDRDVVERLSEEFKRKMPSETFSPAEIQEYLKQHRSSAVAAVESVADWVKSRQDQAESRTEEKSLTKRQRRLARETQALGQDQQDQGTKNRRLTKRQQRRLARETQAR
ncbi:hypothetical protein CCHR01_19495 [Colletotrichum chrysophilum]|uniref:AAA+ ATPase domain-containing protein n=1 Tax=Colletotrichum chrysophilum TaxID=1836956 RepID=A0AAD8ZZK8_9PEZI|nr:hypothetical protein CCHR01_19495 [Colletotrichum chrysophilum]